ncbi:hypothetical protein [Phaeocystidibacter luteus]|uniref:GNAT family N-acetyltransferase n=1 Tax=Phaeocystidibacter luteus TaxID=911197 RepID=A0A6N6RKN4_9FLAO|nr:hypothetical protein [Phaeocystidibacter luteus]KAB2808060.1 hypothetical protein F8C67_10840 [Phaeocystidibacter luteus]
MSEIRFVPAAELDTDKWDACIKADPEGLIYNTSWYLDTLGVDWDALVLGDYETVMPLSRREKFRQHYVFRPFGIQQQGITGKDADRPEVLNRFLEAIPAELKYIEFYTNARNDISKVPSAWQTKENVNLILRVAGSYENLYSNFSSNTKRNIKKAAKQNWNIFEHDPPEVLLRLFKDNQGKKYPVDDAFYPAMRHLMHVLIHKRIGQVWTLQDERNSTVAGIFVMTYQGRATLLFSAMDDFGRENQAMFHLINEYLLLACGHIDVFDFEGSNEPGLQRFYGGFGAVERNYALLKKNNLPIPFRWFK